MGYTKRELALALKPMKQLVVKSKPVGTSSRKLGSIREAIENWLKDGMTIHSTTNFREGDYAINMVGDEDQNGD